MTAPKLTDVNSRYGAPMGRPSFTNPVRAITFKFYLQRVRLNQGGYDDGGAYWGTGQKLYRAYADSVWLADEERDEEGSEWFFRADDREDAKAEVLHLYPNARFYR